MKKGKFFIVVVEDDDGTRTAFEELLKGDDFVVESFPNGLEAKKFIDSLPLEARPDVVLTDTNMPVMDGLELLKFLVGKYRLPRILAMTGRFKESAPLMLAMSGKLENKGLALAAGADVFLLKPIRGVGEKIKEFLKNK